MARHDLITTYLHQLHASLRWRPDAADLVDEAADHLHETTDRLIRAGTDPLAAQTQTLARFGDPVLLARSFALTPHGGLAMPTPFTRTAGTLGLAATALWLLTAAAAWWGGTDLLTDWNSAGYAGWAVLATFAGIGTTLTLAGLLVRSGGLRGPLPGAALLAASVGTVLVGVATWAWPLSTGLLALAAALVVWRLHTAHTTTARRDWLLAAAWPTGIAVFALLTWLQVGPVDSYGDYPIAYAAGFTTGALLFTAALALLGLWLRREEPADLPAPLAHA